MIPRSLCIFIVFSLCEFRAADWNLNEPQWSGRMRMVAKGNSCIVSLEDKTNGELFAKCPIDNYPGVAVESVSDSSRYFVLRIQDDNGELSITSMFETMCFIFLLIPFNSQDERHSLDLVLLIDQIVLISTSRYKIILNG